MIRRYFDNAATSFPKPPGVAEAMVAYMRDIGASAGRGAYREAVESGKMLERTRGSIRRLLGASPADPVIFTLNGSDALNIAIKGVLRGGDHAVTTALDHNSVLRPLGALEAQRGITWTAVEVDPRTTLLDAGAIEAAITPKTTLVVVNHASNVTGAIQPVAEIAAICRRRGLLLAVDAAQSAGHVPIDFAGLGVDLLATPGHKGLLGPLGTGVLLIRAGVEQRMQTFREGGTGSASEIALQPEYAPDKFEAGSHNAVGLAGLLAAVEWLLERDVAALRRHEQGLCAEMIAGLEAIGERSGGGFEWFGPRDPAARVGVFSVRMDAFEPAELAAVLEERFGVLARAGLHCAPFAHRTIGTEAHGGTTRLSLGAFHTAEDVAAAIDALGRIASTVLAPNA